MLLIDRDILAAVARGAIVIDPFDPSSLGTNSYDVHLGPWIKTYQEHFSGRHTEPLDVNVARGIELHHIPRVGMVLQPGELYLASTFEYTESHEHVPFLEGKSSLGRLGMSVHVTAGKGDVGFCNHWTMEITVVKPLRVYAGIRVAQLIWFEASGPPMTSYKDKASAKYRTRDPMPQPSAMWRNELDAVGKFIQSEEGQRDAGMCPDPGSDPEGRR